MAVPGQYLTAVKAASAKYGVPADLLGAQIGAESGWNPNARSPAGAEGISQFMPGTAKGYGINPMDPMQSIDAQGKMMSSLLKSYKGNVPLALAAYNAGAGAVAKAGGKVPNIPETQNYIKTIMATRSRYPGLAGAASGSLPLPSGATATTQMPVGPSGGASQPLSAPTQGVGMGTSIQQLMSLAQQHLSSDPNAAPQPSILDMLQQPAQQPTLTLPSGVQAQTQITPNPTLSPVNSPKLNGGYSALTNAKFAGNDQGVDFTGAGAVHALADGVVTRVQSSGSGWPGQGGMVVYKMTSGPQAGKYVYMAEDLAPAAGLKPGMKISAGQQIATATGAAKAPGIEVGFAQNAHGSAYGTTHDGKKGNPAPYGAQMAQFIASLSKPR